MTKTEAMVEKFGGDNCEDLYSNDRTTPTTEIRAFIVEEAARVSEIRADELHRELTGIIEENCQSVFDDLDRRCKNQQDNACRRISAEMKADVKSQAKEIAAVMKQFTIET